MKKNYIVKDNDKIRHSINLKTTMKLKSHYTENNSMYDLLQNWIRKYSDQLIRNRPISLSEFVAGINDIQPSYKKLMVELLEA